MCVDIFLSFFRENLFSLIMFKVKFIVYVLRVAQYQDIILFSAIITEHNILCGLETAR